MDRDTAREELKGYLKEYVESVTTASRKAGRGMYICPICGSGTGKSQSGAFSIDPGTNYTTWKCFACQQGGDIFDLIGMVENLTGHTAQLERASALFGVPVDGYSPRQEYQKQPENGRYTHSGMQSTTHTPTQESGAVDFTSFFLQAHANISATDYPAQRGLSPEIVSRFKLGYVEEWRHSKSPNAPASPRLIIPTSRHSYTARDIRPESEQRYRKEGSMHIFNRRALKESPAPVYVVEGELDALSIMDVGGEAVALGSVSSVPAFLEVVKIDKPAQPLILALDNDRSGEDATRKLTEGLQKLGIFSYRYNPAGSYKDANEALQHDRAGLCSAVAQGVAEVQEERDKEAQEARERYLQTSAAHYLQSFQNGIKDSVETRAISTGFFYLDRALGDTYATSSGLYEGLYIVGAISSLGKTTLIMQIADQIAQAGQDVLIFSLEMARSEIMAKSISRHTCQLAAERGIDPAAAKTARGITTGARYSTYSPLELGLINDAMAAYSSYAGHVFILEGVGDIGAEQIRKAVEEHIHHTGAAPVVIVDYLQILAPAPKDRHMTDKQNTDKAVMELKRISRDYKIPVIGISSFNRQNYKEAVSMEAFKESGAIEYSSDVLIGLQLKGAGEKSFDVNTAKSKNPREVELVILKNRNGKTGGKVTYNYYPMFNFYREMPQ